MTCETLLRWLLKVLVFIVTIDILLVTCCSADSPADTPETYLPQTAPQASFLAGCPQPGKWALSTWSGPTTDTITALASCLTPEGAGAIDAAYYLDPTTNGWRAWYRGRPEISTLTELTNMQGILTFGAPTPAPEPVLTPTVYWPTLLDGEITFRSNAEIAAWVEEVIEEGWQIEATYGGDDAHHADLQIALQDKIIWDGQHACGLASDGANGICHVALSEWCFNARDIFLVDDVPEKTLLHEVGHCMGLSHREWGVMTPVVQNWTTEEDIEEIHTTYGLD